MLPDHDPTLHPTSGDIFAGNPQIIFIDLNSDSKDLFGLFDADWRRRQSTLRRCSLLEPTGSRYPQADVPPFGWGSLARRVFSPRRPSNSFLCLSKESDLATGVSPIGSTNDSTVLPILPAQSKELSFYKRQGNSGTTVSKCRNIIILL